MFGFGDKKIPEPKCYATHGALSGSWIDRDQIPTRPKPFSTINSHPFNHTVELILPEELYKPIGQNLDRDIAPIKYSKVILALSQLLDGDFFTQYIKIGNVLMLSEGRLGVDNVYSLNDGILRLSLDKETYERAGLVGKPAVSAGKRGTRARWLVEINLRLPSMLHSKKGFERIVWSFKNVLKDPLTWLFLDLAQGGDAIKKHHPATRVSMPKVNHLGNLKVPILNPPERSLSTFRDEFCDYALNLQEWLALVSIESPRITVEDKIDPFLSRYDVEQDLVLPEAKIVRVKWKGMLPAHWIAQLFAICINSSKCAEPMAWFALTVYGFRNSPVSWKQSQHGDSLHGENGYTVMKLPHHSEGDPSLEYVLWELVGGLDSHS